MRVLLATPWLHPLGGGLERYADAVARHLAADGHDVTLLGHAHAASVDRREGVRRVAIRPARVISNTPLSLTAYRVAREIMRERPHDVVNVHAPVPGTAEVVALAARRHRVPHVLTYHAGRQAGPRGILSFAARVHEATVHRWLARSAASRVAVSPFVAQNALAGLSCDIVPPGVDVERFHAAAAPVPGRIVFVGPVARAYAWKGLSVLIDAFQRIPLAEAHLRVIGTGDLVPYYRDRTAGRAVSFHARVGDDELVREMSRASVLVLPSTSPAESFGMVLAEANACGRPVVASRIGGIPSFVRDGDNGLLVPPGDPVALADALTRLLGDPTLARVMGERGRIRVTAEHAWPALARATADILERAFTAMSARGR